MSRRENFENAFRQLWLYIQNGEPVGRLSTNRAAELEQSSYHRINLKHYWELMLSITKSIIHFHLGRKNKFLDTSYYSRAKGKVPEMRLRAEIDSRFCRASLWKGSSVQTLVIRFVWDWTPYTETSSRYNMPKDMVNNDLLLCWHWP